MPECLQCGDTHQAKTTRDGSPAYKEGPMNVTLGSELEKVAHADYYSPSTLVQEAVQRLLAV